MIMLNWASMCLDPGHFEEPLKFDFDRRITVNPAFGTGAHRCAGAHLARMNIATALRVWLDRIPEFSLKPGTQPVFTAGIVREMYDFYLEFPAGGK
jgi:cytochrome P450